MSAQASTGDMAAAFRTLARLDGDKDALFSTLGLRQAERGDDDGSARTIGRIRAPWARAVAWSDVIADRARRGDVAGARKLLTANLAQLAADKRPLAWAYTAVTWPILTASLIDPTKVIPAAIMLTETGKIVAWGLNVFFETVDRCSLPTEDLRVECENVKTLFATVERTVEEVREANAKLGPRPIPPAR